MGRARIQGAKKGPDTEASGPFALVSDGLLGAAQCLHLVRGERPCILDRRRIRRAGVRHKVDLNAAVLVGLGRFLALTFFLRGQVRGAAETRLRIRGLIGPDPIDLDARRIDLAAGAGSTAQDGSGVERALFIERECFCASACAPATSTATACRCGVFGFVIIAMAYEDDVVIAIRNSRSSFVDKDALTAVVHASLVLREDYV